MGAPPHGADRTLAVVLRGGQVGAEGGVRGELRLAPCVGVDESRAGAGVGGGGWGGSSGESGVSASRVRHSPLGRVGRGLYNTRGRMQRRSEAETNSTLATPAMPPKLSGSAPSAPSPSPLPPAGTLHSRARHVGTSPGSTGSQNPCLAACPSARTPQLYSSDWVRRRRRRSGARSVTQHANNSSLNVRSTRAARTPRSPLTPLQIV